MSWGCFRGRDGVTTWKVPFIALHSAWRCMWHCMAFGVFCIVPGLVKSAFWDLFGLGLAWRRDTPTTYGEVLLELISLLITVICHDTRFLIYTVSKNQKAKMLYNVHRRIPNAVRCSAVNVTRRWSALQWIKMRVAWEVIRQMLRHSQVYAPGMSRRRHCWARRYAGASRSVDGLDS